MKKLFYFNLMALAMMFLSSQVNAQVEYPGNITPPKVSDNVDKRCMTSGYILEPNGLSSDSPTSFTTDGTNKNQGWSNSSNEILAYKGATFNLKVSYNPTGWGSLTVFMLRSDDTTFNEDDKIYGTYEGDWYSNGDALKMFKDNITGEGVVEAGEEEGNGFATFSISIPEDIEVGQFVVIRFITCKDEESEGKPYDRNPLTQTAYELNYCDYIVRIVKEEQAPVPCTLTKVIEPEEGGSVSVTVNGTEVNGTVNKGDVIKVTYENNEGFIFESIEVTGATKVEETDNEYTVEDNVKVTVRFREETSSIGTVEVASVYYNAAEQVLYANGKVTVYDMTGRVVLVNEGNTSVAHLADGIYTAVVNGKAVKFNK